VSLSGLRTRAKNFDSNLAFHLEPSSHDSVNVYLGASTARYNGIGNSDFNYYSAGVSYGRKLSAHTSLTASVVVAKSDYLHTRLGDGTIITPQAGVEHQFSPTLTFGISGGASIARTHRADGSLENFTSFSGQAHLCNLGNHSSLCLTAARMAQPTANGGLSAVTSISGTYTNQFNLKNTVSMNVQYSKNDSSTPLQIGASEFYGMSASLAHNFNRRISAFITPSFSKITGNLSPHESDFQLQAGVRFRFGALS
jgi:hypothetical protein